MGKGHISGAMRFVAVFLKQEDGANAAEFALVVLPMTLFTLAILEVGSLFFAYNDMHNSAREAVRRLAVDERLDITNEDGAVYTCDDVPSGSLPDSDSAAEVACNYLAGWSTRFDVEINLMDDPLLEAVHPTALSCNALTVTISSTMGSVALFDLFNILGTTPLVVEATMLTEFTLGGAVFCD